MKISTRYEHSPGLFLWPIPFPFDSPKDVGARLVKETGLEQELIYGKDFSISHNRIVYTLPENCSLIVYLAGTVDSVLASQARTLAREGASEFTAAPAATSAAYTSTTAASSSLESKLQALLDMLAAQAAQPMLANAAPVNQTPAYDPATGRLDSLEQQVATILTAQAEAKESARTKAAGEKIEEIEKAGAKAESALDMKTDVAMDAITLATAEAEQLISGKAAEALAVAAKADIAADKAKAASETVEAATEEALAKLERRIDAIEASINDKALYAEQRAATASHNAEAAIRAASAQACAEAAAASRLAGMEAPQTGWKILAGKIEAGGILELPKPLAYFPGRNSLIVIRNGFALCMGQEYEEIGNADGMANSIRLTSAANAEDLFSFYVLPTNITHAAKSAAAEARASSRAAHEDAARASGYAASVTEAANKCLTANARHQADINKLSAEAQEDIRSGRLAAINEITSKGGKARENCVKLWNTASKEIKSLGQSRLDTLLDTWQKAEKAIANVRVEAQAKAEQAAKLAGIKAEAAGALKEESQSLAHCAWRAAMQASLASARPGIGCVPDLPSLNTMPAGVYLVNPAITVPLPFMGVWPVMGMEHTNFDGVFLVGLAPYPEEIKTPDIPYPENPEDVPDMKPPAMESDNWLPCGHRH